MRDYVNTLSDRVTAGEAPFFTLAHRVSALEQSQDTHRDTAITLQLHMEDIEERGCRNNLWLRGIPEATGAENLGEMVAAIFRRVLETPPMQLKLDRVHRALIPRSTDPDRPRDVVCRLHHYTQKEDILHSTWEHGDVDHNGA